jgi:hypothetical protein
MSEFGDLTPRMLNKLFTVKLDSEEGRKEAQEVGAGFIRTKLREDGFLRKIVPPVRITEADCQRSVDHDTLVKIIDIEYDSTAMPITFRGEPTVNYIEGERYEIRFHSIFSERFKKTEQELRAYEYPIKKVIEENIVKDIQKVEDSRFLYYADAAATAVSNVVDRTGAGAGFDACDKANLSRAFIAIDGDQLRATQILMSDVLFDSFVAQDNSEFGDQLLGEITKDGYKYNTILGRRLITSNKTDILSTSAVYVFTDAQYLGNFFTLGDVNFYVDKTANMITMEAWEDIGAGIGNNRAVAKLLVNPLA